MGTTNVDGFVSLLGNIKFMRIYTSGAIAIKKISQTFSTLMLLAFNPIYSGKSFSLVGI